MTKTGDIAGPRVLEHIVDVVLYLEVGTLLILLSFLSSPHTSNQIWLDYCLQKRGWKIIRIYMIVYYVGYVQFLHWSHIVVVCIVIEVMNNVIFWLL